MPDREELTLCRCCDEPIWLGEKHVGILTSKARVADGVMDVEEAVCFQAFCEICATDMDFRFLFPEVREEGQDQVEEILLRRGKGLTGRGNGKGEEDPVEMCQLCLGGIDEGEWFRTIEAESNVITERGAELREPLTMRAYCEDCEGLFDFQATEVYRRGHDPNYGADPPYPPSEGFLGRRWPLGND